MSARFDWRFEVESIERGMRKDLQDQVGQTVNWFQFDSDNSVIDPIYDVGGTPLGRKYLPPIFLPVLNAIKLEGEEVQNDRGFYVVDTFRIIFAADAAIKAGLGDIIFKPDQHNIDRLIYENKVFGVDQIRVRGILTAEYVVCGVDCKQIKDEELVNDPQFQSFISTTSPAFVNTQPFYPSATYSRQPRGSVTTT